MRVLVLHSDVGENPPPDELETVATARAIAEALRTRGHDATLAPFDPDPAIVRGRIAAAQAVFNMVESVHGLGAFAPLAPAMLETMGVPYTGCGSASMALAGDKPLTKHILRAAGLPTADWSEPPQWTGLRDDRRYIVKSATEDASLGLDDGAVVLGAGVRARAAQSAMRHGGRWFAEAYLEGREFNVAVLEDAGQPRVLPIPEMKFESWLEGRPRIVGYAAKWDEGSPDSAQTVRVFGTEPALDRELSDLARRTWSLLGLRGFARIDFRIDAEGRPAILEVNPNPCLDPHSGFAAAAAQANLSFAECVDLILRAAVSG
ncbi:MAG: D-alanine--D-alanine ligase [Rhizomicrobium sp.]|jgi:D-alanine-D-alanine ligase